ncbi:hypothetical protein TSMEX_008377 [Taenia solium]|eukprot:TsM_000049300 transcript=TsM_000049300 gene=TsM_000049300
MDECDAAKAMAVSLSMKQHVDDVFCIEAHICGTFDCVSRSVSVTKVSVLFTPRTRGFTDSADEWKLKAVTDVLTVLIAPENEDTTCDGLATSAASSAPVDEAIDLLTWTVDVMLS